MAWGPVSGESLDTAGTNSTSLIELLPGETAHVMVENLGVERGKVEVFGTVDGTNFATVASMEFRIAAGEDGLDFTVTQDFGFRVTVSNDESGSSLLLDVDWRLNTVDFSA
jgi:hypothetical protein